MIKQQNNNKNIKKQRKEAKGITLIALVCTIVVLLILAAISITVVVDENGLIQGAKKTQEDIENAANLTVDIINSIKAEIEDQDLESYMIRINTDTTLFNESLGNFQVVYKVIGQKNEKLVYCDIVTTEISSPEMQTITMPVELPQDTKITVTEVYSGASYDLANNTKKEQVQVLNNQNELATFNYTHQYNYKMISNAVAAK